MEWAIIVVVDQGMPYSTISSNLWDSSGAFRGPAAPMRFNETLKRGSLSVANLVCPQRSLWPVSGITARCLVRYEYPLVLSLGVLVPTSTLDSPVRVSQEHPHPDSTFEACAGICRGVFPLWPPQVFTPAPRAGGFPIMAQPASPS